MLNQNKLKGKDLKAFAIDVVPYCCDPEDVKFRMKELKRLIKTYGGVSLVRKIQKKDKPDYNTYIGSWKLDEIVREMKARDANLLIIWNKLKPKQIYNINKKLKKIDAQARDRVDLILKIFEKAASTMESKLQIELASIRHMGPRIYGMGMELSRQWGGGIWAKWKWEKNTEIMERHLQEREEQIKKKLEKYENVREQHRKGRRKKNLDTVWIVGYTNAGKTTLLNALSKKWGDEKDQLFATLSTQVGKMYVWTDKKNYEGQEILLSDTIGFIQDLPPQLIQAFKSTLEDSVHSDLLLEVIDASDQKRIQDKISVVDKILNDIWTEQKRIYVFNKVDRISKKEKKKLEEKYEWLDPIFISAREEKGLDALKKKIVEKLGYEVKEYDDLGW